MRRRLVLLAVAALASACASTSGPPAAAPLALGPGAWRVVAPIGGEEPPRMAALREAAAVTLAQGGDWFHIVERAPPPRDYKNPEFMNDFASPLDETASARTLDFTIGRGPKPEEMEAYDAHEVSRRLGPARGPVPSKGAGAQI